MIILYTGVREDSCFDEGIYQRMENNTPSEYGLLQSEISDKKRGFGAGFADRPNGGSIFTSHGLMIYTDKNNNPEHVIRINKGNEWKENGIQQDAAQYEKEGLDFDIQREILQSWYGEDCADFDSISAPGTIAWKDGRGADRTEGETSRGDRENLPIQTGDGTEFSISTGELTDAQRAQMLHEAGVDYESAVARGDMEAAQEDVEFYAEQNGYDIL